MAQERLSMRKIKEVLRLYFELRLGKKKIARACSVSPSTVKDYVLRFEKAGLTWPLSEEMDDSALSLLLFPSEGRRSSKYPTPEFGKVHEELKKKGGTLMLLWQEYKERHTEGHQYSRFCDLYRKWAKKLDLSLRQEYRAGEKLFVDFAGKTIPVIDPSTGEIRDAKIFVAVMGASSYTYAEAVPSEDLPSWTGAHIRAFEYFGGVPEIIVPDNLRSGVSKTCRYEPDINPTYHDLCKHYGTVVIPARVARPKDKAKVEVGVLLVTRWIIAVLRHHTFFSIHELNERIMELLEKLNFRLFRKFNRSRRDLFDAIDRPALKPLPETRYEYAEWKKATVSIDYHIEVDGHFYSVPYQLVRQQVEVRITASVIEVLFKGKRIATHRRSHRKGGFTSIHEHRPKSHQKYLEWTPSRFISWAEKTGPHTKELIEKVLAGKLHPEQGFRTCLGILGLGKKYETGRLEAACQRALAIRAFSYRSIKSILESGYDRKPLKDQNEEVIPSIQHKNIRGHSYYLH